MKSRRRRELLKGCIGCVPLLMRMPGAWALAQSPGGLATDAQASAAATRRKPDTVDRYIDPLPIPKPLTPESDASGEPLYRMRMMEFSKPLHSQLPPTRLWGYEGQYPGPLLDTTSGKAFQVQWEDQLPAHHMFALDGRIHGAMPPAPEVRTSPLLAGSLRAEEDARLPENWLVAGQQLRRRYTNRQQPATLWYRDQAAGIARLNVYAGLAGMCLLRDTKEATFGLPVGPYEIPLLLQDRTLDNQGQLVYRPSFDDGQHAPPSMWGPQFFGELPLVNGAISPYLQVEPRAYRLRILNGANFRFLNLYFNLAGNAADIPALVSFQVIGMDGGFLNKPAELRKMLLAPGERVDLIADFAKLEGKTVTLSNDAAAPYPGWNLIRSPHRALYEWMQFRVTLPLAGSKSAVSYSIPAPTAFPNESTAVASRDFVLAEAFDRRGRSLGVEFNGKGYDDAVTEQVKAGSVEKWRFINSTDDAHPMDIHRAQFQVLQRQGFDTIALRAGTVVPVGRVRPAGLQENGWKDTAVVHPGEILTLLVQFSPDAERSAFCTTLLEPQDRSLIRPFEIVAPVQPTAK